jgi:hypothetical protein
MWTLLSVLLDICTTGCIVDPATNPEIDPATALESATGAAASQASSCDGKQGCRVSAAVDDSITASTTDFCGTADFVDHGPGKPGGGDNDDYVVIHDRCPDHHGVQAWAYLNDKLIGIMYNGNGLRGAPVIWDPYTQGTNVKKGDVFKLRVCLVDGPNDRTPSRCGENVGFTLDG